MKRETGIGVTVWLTMTMITFATLIALSQPETGQIEIWIPDGAVVDKVIASDIHWSGTISTISMETFQAMELKEQKVRVQLKGAWLIIHYEGKDEAGFSYHAAREYYPGFLRTFENPQIEGNILRYTVGRDWVFICSCTTLGGCGGAILGLITYVAIESKKDC